MDIQVIKNIISNNCSPRLLKYTDTNILIYNYLFHYNFLLDSKNQYLRSQNVNLKNIIRLELQFKIQLDKWVSTVLNQEILQQLNSLKLTISYRDNFNNIISKPEIQNHRDKNKQIISILNYSQDLKDLSNLSYKQNNNCETLSDNYYLFAFKILSDLSICWIQLPKIFPPESPIFLWSRQQLNDLTNELKLLDKQLQAHFNKLKTYLLAQAIHEQKMQYIFSSTNNNGFSTHKFIQSLNLKV